MDAGGEGVDVGGSSFSDTLRAAGLLGLRWGDSEEGGDDERSEAAVLDSLLS